MIRITYSGSPVITLRNPEWDDLDRVETNGIVRHTRAGELKYYKDATWPFVHTYVFQFIAITKTVIDVLRTVLATNAGKELVLARIEGITTKWSRTGYIITPEFDIITQRETCYFDVNFEFQQKVV